MCVQVYRRVWAECRASFPIFFLFIFYFFLSVLCRGRALTFVCVFVHFPCVRRCVHDNFPKTRRLRFHSLMLPPHPSTTSISEGQKEITRVLLSFFFFLWGFMVQKKSQTTTRVIKLSMERLETPTKVVSDMWDWAAKCLRM